MLGKINSYNICENLITINYEHGVRYVAIINDDVINFYEGKDKHSLNVEKNNILFKVDFNKYLDIYVGKYHFTCKEDFLIDFYINDICVSKGCYANIITEDVNYEILEKEGHNVIKKESKNILLAQKLNEEDYIYGLGDKMSFVNKRGYLYENWNTDDPSAQNENYTSLYKSIPFYITFNKLYKFGMFIDNHYHTYFDLGKSKCDELVISSDGGLLDYYFIGGDTLLQICSNYSNLVGRLDLPAMFSLGHQQSRWGYKTKDEILEICKTYRELNIKCDVIHLDIDYMDNYKVFTTNKEAFGDFKKFVEELHQMNFKVVCIIDPGVKKETGYDVYEELVSNDLVAKLDDNVYINEVWPGESVFPSFNKKQTREFWAKKVKILLDLGVDGIWNDMNEPASFKGPLPLNVMFDGEGHDGIHNLYAHYMAEATSDAFRLYSNKRAYIITRAAYSKTAKYSTVWTGDNQSLWHHLRLGLSQLSSLSMSGFSFCGLDIGGFGGDVTEELMIRFIEASIFNPLFRNHSAMGTRRQEPYQFSDNVVNIYRRFVEVRYNLISYMYDCFYKYNKDGYPVIRPLVLNYENDKETYEINDSIMLGDSLLLCPVVDQGVSRRVVYLPGGNWYNYFTNEVKSSGYHLEKCMLDETLLYVKEGSVLPISKFSSSVEVLNEITFNIYPGNGEYYHYQDDGLSVDGKYNLYYIKHVNNNVEIKVCHNDYKLYDKIILKYKEKEITITDYNNLYCIE